MPKTAETRGRLIMFDAADGAGKTTQLELVAAALEKDGLPVYTTRAHGGTAIGELLRDVSLSDTPRQPTTDLLLSRTIHAELAYDLAARRAAGITCLVDRSPASMWAYQVRGSRLDPEFAEPVITDDMRLLGPDLLIIYDATLEVLRGRISGRTSSKTDYFEAQPDDYHQRVIDGYREASVMFKAVVISADQLVEAVHAETMRAIARMIPQLDSKTA